MKDDNLDLEALDTYLSSDDSPSYCQIWCSRVFGHAAIWSGFVVSILSLNVMTLASNAM